jgi:hypothetical protein
VKEMRKRKKKPSRKRPLLLSQGPLPSFFLSFLLFFPNLFLSYSFSLSLLNSTPCAQQQMFIIATKGAKEGVHEKEATMEGVQFHCHHHHVLKNLNFFPNLKGSTHFRGLGALD